MSTYSNLIKKNYLYLIIYYNFKKNHAHDTFVRVRKAYHSAKGRVMIKILKIMNNEPIFGLTE